MVARGPPGVQELLDFFKGGDVPRACPSAFGSPGAQRLRPRHAESQGETPLPPARDTALRAGVLTAPGAVTGEAGRWAGAGAGQQLPPPSHAAPALRHVPNPSPGLATRLHVALTDTAG